MGLVGVVMALALGAQVDGGAGADAGFTPVKASLLVWATGATREEADAAVAAYRQRQGNWSEALQLPTGFPRVVESANVPGLKPGFFVVVLGVCPDADAKPVLEAYKAVEPGVGVRPVTWKGPPACPGMAAGWKWPVVQRVRGKTHDLTGVMFVNASGVWQAVLQLRDKNGKLVEESTLGEGLGCESMALSTAGGMLRFAGTCNRPGCTAPDVYEIDTRVGIKDGTVDLREKDKLLRKGACED